MACTRVGILWIITFVTIRALAVSPAAQAVDCPALNYSLFTQADVDDFPQDCDRVSGGLTIGGSAGSDPIGDLSPLSGLLETQSLTVTGHTTLKSLDGLDTLIRVVGDLSINTSPSLRDCQAVAHLIDSNPGNGTTGGTVTITLGNGPGCRGVGPGVGGALGTVLTDVDEDSIQDHLDPLCTYDPELDTQADVDLFPRGCRVIDGYMTIVGGGITNLHALSRLVRIIDGMDMTAPDLPSVEGLGALERIGDAYMENNTSLTSLQGLGSLKRADAGLSLSGNTALADCSKLQTLLDSVDEDSDGPNAPGSNTDPADVSGTITISNNAAGCNSLLEIVPLTAGPGSTARHLVSGAECPSSAVLSSQKLVNEFPKACTALSGSLEITGAGVVELSQLEDIISVGGSLKVEGTDLLTHIGGLSSINSVGGSLIVRNNTALEKIDALTGIASTGADLTVQGNPALEHINGLSNLTTVGGTLRVANNVRIEDIDALSGVTFVAEDIDIEANAALKNVDGLSGIANTSVANLGDLLIRANPALENIDGLANFTSSGSDVVISDNASLMNLQGLAKLTSIVEGLIVDRNPQLTDLQGLNALETLEVLEIQSNAGLLSLDGLESLSTVFGSLTIDANASLASIDGLESLTTVLGDLTINANPSLISIDALSGVSVVDGLLLISSNNALPNLDGLVGLTQPPSIELDNNDSLSDLSGLGHLSAFDFVFINAHNSLQTLDGLANLESVKFNIFVTSNPILSDCSALNALLDSNDDGVAGPGDPPIPDLGNPAASEILDNASGCRSIDEIVDTDGDGLQNWEDNFPNDFDNDGVDDNLDAFPTDPTETVDSDGDGLGDNREAQLGTNPNVADSDGDGFSDSDEVDAGSDPLAAGDVPSTPGLSPALIRVIVEQSEG